MMMSGPAAALHRRRHARLDVVLVDPLDAHLDARLLAELLGLLLEQRVRGGNEVRPLQQVQARALRERGRAPGGGEHRGGGGGLEEVPTAQGETTHGEPPWGMPRE